MQIGTTSLAAVQQYVKPKQQADIFNGSSDVVEAFKIKRVQAIVVTDLATAEYLASSELKHAVVVGKFNAPSGNNWGVLLSKGSSLLRMREPRHSDTHKQRDARRTPQQVDSAGREDSVPEDVNAPGATAGPLGMLAQL